MLRNIYGLTKLIQNKSIASVCAAIRFNLFAFSARKKQQKRVREGEPWHAGSPSLNPPSPNAFYCERAVRRKHKKVLLFHADERSFPSVAEQV